MEYCQLYFNFYCLFFPSYVNVTTWSIAYAIPHHALKIYDKYRIGYGIIYLHAKEAKHSGIKSDLALSNVQIQQNKCNWEMVAGHASKLHT